MNKKIKAIELASRVYQRKDIPKKVKYNSTEYKYSEEFCDYENQLGNYLFSIITLRAYWMNEEVEILEDEEEIDIQGIEEINKLKETNIWAKMSDCEDKANQLVRAVKQLDKKINKEYCQNCGDELTENNKYMNGMCMECKCGIDWKDKED